MRLSLIHPALAELEEIPVVSCWTDTLPLVQSLIVSVRIRPCP